MTWRDKMDTMLLDICKSEGINTYDEAKIKDVIKKLADAERSKPNNEQIGFAYCVDKYSEKGWTSLMNTMCRLYGETPKKSTTPKAPKPKAEGEPNQAPPPLPRNSNANEQECAITVGVHPQRFTSKRPEDLVALLHAYLFGESSFKARVVDAVNLQDDWWDIKVVYSNNLEDVLKTLEKNVLISSAVTKPAVEFGRMTASIV